MWATTRCFQQLQPHICLLALWPGAFSAVDAHGPIVGPVFPAPLSAHAAFRSIPVPLSFALSLFPPIQWPNAPSLVGRAIRPSLALQFHSSGKEATGGPPAPSHCVLRPQRPFCKQTWRLFVGISINFAATPPVRTYSQVPCCHSLVLQGPPFPPQLAQQLAHHHFCTIPAAPLPPFEAAPPPRLVSPSPFWISCSFPIRNLLP